MILSVPGLEWDGQRTLTIAGRRYPCGMMVDPAGGLWGGATMTSDPWCEHGWMVFIPTESGLAIGITMEREHAERDGRWVPVLDSPTPISCDLYMAWFPSDFDPDWLGRDAPVRGGVGRGEIVPLRRRLAWLRNPTTWSNCDPEWLAEHVDRLSTLPVRLEPEWRAGWIHSIREMHEQFRDDFGWGVDPTPTK